MRCPECGHENERNESVCARCGAALPVGRTAAEEPLLKEPPVEPDGGAGGSAEGADDHRAEIADEVESPWRSTPAGPGAEPTWQIPLGGATGAEEGAHWPPPAGPPRAGEAPSGPPAGGPYVSGSPDTGVWSQSVSGGSFTGQPYVGQPYVGQPFQGEPGSEQEASARRTDRRLLTISLIAIGLGVVMVAVVAGALLWPHSSDEGTVGPGPPPAGGGGGNPGGDRTRETFYPKGGGPVVPPDHGEEPNGGGGGEGDQGAGRAQAGRIDSLLDDMAESRNEVNAAVTEARHCSGLDAAVPRLEQVSNERSRQLGVASALDVDALNNGTGLKGNLVSALRASRDADQEYEEWARGWQTLGCTGRTPQDGDYQQANDISENRATPAKQRFAELWRPVAQQYGLESRGADDF